MSKQYIAFFHNSDDYFEKFSSKDEKRPCFYWFSDSYFSHIGIYKYFYLFVKNPQKDNIEFNARAESDDFNGLYQSYLYFLKEREAVRQNGKGYAEPSILVSFSNIEPDLIAEYKDDKFIILKPYFLKNRELNLLGEEKSFNKTVPFIEIPEIVEAAPNIKNSLPFIEPDKNGDRYVYDNWLQMKGNHGWWL
ncbi:MAG: hypothetical protein GX453_06520 [Lactococcus chungangensis]|uniref:Uncharacterized protein n=1 Tax=Pseudolactococcus chungangensis TaxID=451457 RepID=A0A847J563_9LACT|nr:hypothetical protein [Lactococcus chungangensis]